MTSDLRQQIVALLPRLRRFARALCGAVEPADALVRRTFEQPLSGALDRGLFRVLYRLWLEGARPMMATQARGEEPRLRSLIPALPEAERAVLALVWIEELSYRETAAILDLPVGTVMRRLSQARKILAEAIDSPVPTETGGSTVSEDMLMAYADGVLEGGMADAVGRAVDADPDLVARFGAWRRARALARAAFADVLEEVVPPQLLAAAGVEAPPRTVRRRFRWLPGRWRR